MSGATFAGSGMTATGTGCPSEGCTASVNGFFAGPAAERAGMGYQIATPGPTISGAAALTR